MNGEHGHGERPQRLELTIKHELGCETLEFLKWAFTKWLGERTAADKVNDLADKVKQNTTEMSDAVEENTQPTT